MRCSELPGAHGPCVNSRGFAFFERFKPDNHIKKLGGYFGLPHSVRRTVIAPPPAVSVNCPTRSNNRACWGQIVEHYQYVHTLPREVLGERRHRDRSPECVHSNRSNGAALVACGRCPCLLCCVQADCAAISIQRTSTTTDRISALRISGSFRSIECSKRAPNALIWISQPFAWGFLAAKWLCCIDRRG